MEVSSATTKQESVKEWNPERNPTLVMIDGFRAKVLSPYLLQFHNDNVALVFDKLGVLTMSNGVSINVHIPRQISAINGNSILRFHERLPLKEGILEAAKHLSCLKLSEKLVKGDNLLVAYMLPPGRDGKNREDYAKFYYADVKLSPDDMECVQSAD